MKKKKFFSVHKQSLLFFSVSLSSLASFKGRDEINIGSYELVDVKFTGSPYAWNFLRLLLKKTLYLRTKQSS